MPVAEERETIDHIASRLWLRVGETVKFRPVLQVLLLTINSAAASMLVAQDAKIRIRVTPPDALISIDGKSCGKGPIREIQTIPGPHVVIVSKYDFTSERREVLLRKEDNPGLEFTLRRRDNTFSAQSGGIQIETESSAAVLVNGDANDYFIDHPPMLNNNPTCFVRQFDEWSPALCQLAPR